MIKKIDGKTGANIIEDGYNKMANLCIAVCPKVNGVSKLHSEILAAETFRTFAERTPSKIIGITNGVTHRRWLGKANPGLTALIEDSCGDFLKDYSLIDKNGKPIMASEKKLETFAAEAANIKAENKLRLRDHIFAKQGIEIDETALIDTQAKRLHEYKRQLLKAFHILKLYIRIKEGRAPDMPKTVFVFAGKAYPGYNRAKDIIRLILAIAALVDSDPEASKLMQVVFLADYNVSEAEILMPATDISEQISTAGYEASGTGNMKFMMNGAVTLGTLDGSNVEIREQVGDDNIFIFGATADEVSAMRESYSPLACVEGDEELKTVLGMLISGELAPAGAKNFYDIYNSLINEDKYLVLHDLASYDARFFDCVRAYQDKTTWNKIATANILRSGYFSSDRTVEEYNNELWKLLPVSKK
jgi:starch phosphorylase